MYTKYYGARRDEALRRRGEERRRAPETPMREQGQVSEVVAVGQRRLAYGLLWLCGLGCPMLAGLIAGGSDSGFVYLLILFIVASFPLWLPALVMLQKPRPQA